MTIKCPLEYQEAITLNQWAKYHPICKCYLIHIANERKCTVIQGKHLKDQGLKKGVSDYFLAYPSNGYHGLFLELKRKDKKLCRITREQLLYLHQQFLVGYAAEIAYGFDHAVEIIEGYLC